MTLPAFLKSPYIMGSAGVVGIGGVSIASLAGGGGVDYSEHILRNVSGRDKLVNSLSTAGRLESMCFKEFFGSDDKLAFGSSFSSDSFSTPTKPTVSGWSETPQGCSYAQFFSKGNEAFIFQTETTIKNDKVGLALFSFGRNVINMGTSIVEGSGTKNKLISKTDNVIMYYLFFLEKVTENWELKGGYSWPDNRFSGGFNGVTLHLKFPSGDISINNKWSGITGEMEYRDNEWTQKVYYGSWEGKEGGSGKEVFEDIELWGDSKGSAEILGRDYSKTFDDTKGGKWYGNEDFTIKKYEYKVEGTNSNAWHQRQKLAVGTLDEWYTPFKGKKGNWIETKINKS